MDGEQHDEDCENHLPGFNDQEMESVLNDVNLDTKECSQQTMLVYEKVRFDDDDRTVRPLIAC